ncbi:MAG: hypothetical protein F6K30_30460 [Cyanothece sp. SIO2G6]|nr:hypothetical protein [Cyanothece sp. SIO2G6]
METVEFGKPSLTSMRSPTFSIANFMELSDSIGSLNGRIKQDSAIFIA